MVSDKAHTLVNVGSIPTPAPKIKLKKTNKKGKNYGKK